MDNETIINKRRLIGLCEKCGGELHHFHRYKYCPFCGRKIKKVVDNTTTNY